jgi:hypothetical protein
MSAFLGSLRKRVFGIPARDLAFERRGFRGNDPAMRERLQQIGQAFVWGYHAALEKDDPEVLVPKLNSFELDLRGFVFEGAAMGLALLDFITPWRRDRLSSYLQGAGGAHAYMVHVGAGWLLARIPGRVAPRLARFDPLLRWLVVDGYGFHEGFFHWQRYVAGEPAPARLAGYGRRAFDQGFGRCLWFIEGGDVARIPQTIAAFAPERRADLWGGVGLAATYAGRVGTSELEALRASAGSSQPCLAQGAAFAAKARQHGGNLVPYTDQACLALCGLPAAQAAQITDDALQNLPPDSTAPAYEIWRQRVQAKLASLFMDRQAAFPAGVPRSP